MDGNFDNCMCLTCSGEQPLLFELYNLLPTCLHMRRLSKSVFLVGDNKDTALNSQFEMTVHRSFLALLSTCTVGNRPIGAHGEEHRPADDSPGRHRFMAKPHPLCCWAQNSRRASARPTGTPRFQSYCCVKDQAAPDVILNTSRR